MIECDTMYPARTPVKTVVTHHSVEGREMFAALGPEAGPASFYGSILPATWSFMLALRARGLASA
jgi:hypothetical protein